MGAATDLSSSTPGVAPTPAPTEDQSAHCARLGAVLRKHRKRRRGADGPWVGRMVGASRCTVSSWESGRSKPSLATLGALARLYRVTLLGVLCEALPPALRVATDAIGGAHTTAIETALVAWESSDGHTPAATATRLALGQTMRDLRNRRRIAQVPTRMPLTPAMCEAIERGTVRPDWATLTRWCTAIGVGPLALIVHAAHPNSSAPPATALLDCGDTQILDPSDPRRRTLADVPGAATIIASVDAWASTVGRTAKARGASARPR